MANPGTPATSAAKKPSATSAGQSGQTKRRSLSSDDDGWAGFDGYRSAKKQKLDEQFNQEKRAWDSNIFAGVAVYVNGYTNPSSDELRRILQRNGGSYEMYLSKTRVTHVIATNLPNSKYHLTKTMPVVRPEWITESVAAGKRLSEVPYLLLGNKSKLQPGLKPVSSVETHKISRVEILSSALGLQMNEIKYLDARKIENDVNRDIKFPHEGTIADDVCDKKHSGVDSYANQLSESPICGVVDTNYSRTYKPEVDKYDDEFDGNISHSTTTLVADYSINVKKDDDDDEDDVVYNSEQEDNDQQNEMKSNNTLLVQSNVSPYKRSRVYSFRKFRKSSSSSFNGPRGDDTNSHDGFIDCSKLDLLDCGERLNQKVKCPLPTGGLKDIGQTSAISALPRCHTNNTILEDSLKATDRLLDKFSVNRNAKMSNVVTNSMMAHGMLPPKVNLTGLHPEELAIPLAPGYLSAVISQCEAVASTSFHKHQSSPCSSEVSNTVPEVLLSSSASVDPEPVPGTRRLSLKTKFAISRPSSISGAKSVSTSESLHPSLKPTSKRTSYTVTKADDKIISGASSVLQHPSLKQTPLEMSSTMIKAVDKTIFGVSSVSVSESLHPSLKEMSSTVAIADDMVISGASSVPTSQHPSLKQTSHRISSAVINADDKIISGASSISATETPHPPLKPTSKRTSSTGTIADGNIISGLSSVSTSESQHSLLKPTSQRTSAVAKAGDQVISGTSFVSTSEAAHTSLKQSPPKTSSTMAKAGDKNFLSEFYSNSRLHHIATWGAEFKAYISEIHKSGNHSFPGREKLRQAHIENALKMGQSETLFSARHGTSQKTVMHIDMDCFFVSVGLLARPDLKGKPVAVTHSRGQGAKGNTDSSLAWEKAEWMKKRNIKLTGLKSKAAENVDDDDALENYEQTDVNDNEDSAETHTFHSMAEIASCSYEARKAGVKNGMFMGTAIKLCPNLQTIPYNFAEYNRISRVLYDVVASYTHDIEAVSCDEMLIDCTDVLSDTGATAMEFARLLRAEMLEKTGCPASVGIGPSILLARLATRRAKPNGQFEVIGAEARDFIKDQLVSDLPGVGYSMSHKLSMLGVHTCGDLQNIPLSTLKQEFGPKTGETLHGFSMGQDNRQIKGDKQRKSVSAEVNYGIRFTKEPEAVTFLQDLSLEVKRRLDAIGVKGRSITLKLMVRRPDAPVETAKFMGHGICNTFNKSSNLPVATNDEKVIAREVVSLYRAQRVVASDVRGIGIQINKLERTGTVKMTSSGPQASGHQSILNFAVPRASSATTSTADSAIMTTTITSAATSVASSECTASTNSRTGSISLCGTSPGSRSGASMESFTSLRSVNRESHLHVINSKADSASCSESHSRLIRTTSAAQKVDSRESNCSTGQQSSLLDTGSNCHNTRVISGANFSSKKFDSLVCGNNFDQSAVIQKVDLPSTSAASDFSRGSYLNIPGPSWKSDSPRSRTNQEIRDDADVSVLSESQIDSDVLQELPSEIAQEILEDLRIRKQRKQNLSRSRSNLPTTSSDSSGLCARNSRNGELDMQDLGSHVQGGLPSLSQLDLGCFNALPSHLQEELRAEYAKQKVTTQRSADKMAALADGNFIHLKSPSKNKTGKHSGAVPRHPKQPDKKGRPRGRKMLKFGSSKVKDGRSDNAHKKGIGTRTSSPCSDVIDCDDEDTNDSRGRYTSEDSSDFQSVRGTVLASCNAESTAGHLQFGNNVRQCQVENRQEKELMFCGACSLDDVRTLMKEWLTSCPEPQPDDVAMVTEYFMELVHHKNLEQAFCLLKFLTRRGTSQNSPQWKECLYNITTCVQNVLCAFYGATFKL